MEIYEWANRRGLKCNCTACECRYLPSIFFVAADELCCCGPFEVTLISTVTINLSYLLFSPSLLLTPPPPLSVVFDLLLAVDLPWQASGKVAQCFTSRKKGLGCNISVLDSTAFFQFSFYPRVCLLLCWGITYSNSKEKDRKTPWVSECYRLFLYTGWIS